MRGELDRLDEWARAHGAGELPPSPRARDVGSFAALLEFSRSYAAAVARARSEGERPVAVPVRPPPAPVAAAASALRAGATAWTTSTPPAPESVALTTRSRCPFASTLRGFDPRTQRTHLEDSPPPTRSRSRHPRSTWIRRSGSARRSWSGQRCRFGPRHSLSCRRRPTRHRTPTRVRSGSTAARPLLRRRSLSRSLVTRWPSPARRAP